MRDSWINSFFYLNSKASIHFLDQPFKYCARTLLGLRYVLLYEYDFIWLLQSIPVDYKNLISGYIRAFWCLDFRAIEWCELRNVRKTAEAMKWKKSRCDAGEKWCDQQGVKRILNLDGVVSDFRGQSVFSQYAMHGTLPLRNCFKRQMM